MPVAIAKYIYERANLINDLKISVTSHYLNMGGFHADDKRIVRLISIATQKFMSDIIDDALQHSKARTHMQNSSTPGGSKVRCCSAYRNIYVYI